MNDCKSCNSEKTISNVKCIVDSCCYNTCQGKCTAGEIQVGSNGGIKGETINCVTYEKRSE